MEAIDITILLAEDDDGQALLVERNLERAGFINQVRRARNGQEALDMVAGEVESCGSQVEDRLVLLLDINMPVLDGIEVLRRLKADRTTASIPVIMLTTTDDPREIARCYELGCNIYITKPVVYEAFVEAISRLGMFLKVVRVPGRLGKPA
ncbi:MAG: response regulator [Planctomycetes bacterium]|nr:response regulator [Planctomycetota bacterium]